MFKAMRPDSERQSDGASGFFMGIPGGLSRRKTESVVMSMQSQKGRWLTSFSEAMKEKMGRKLKDAQVAFPVSAAFIEVKISDIEKRL